MKKIFLSFSFVFIFCAVASAYNLTLLVTSSYWTTNVLLKVTSLNASNPAYPLGATVIPIDPVVAALYSNYSIDTNSDWLVTFYDVTIPGPGLEHGHQSEAILPPSYIQSAFDSGLYLAAGIVATLFAFSFLRSITDGQHEDL